MDVAGERTDQHDVAARSLASVKTKWFNWNRRAKAEWKRAYGSTKPTGGGPSQPLSAWTNLMSETIGIELRTAQQIPKGYGVANPVAEVESNDEEILDPKESDEEKDSPVKTPPFATHPTKAAPKSGLIEIPVALAVKRRR